MKSVKKKDIQNLKLPEKTLDALEKWLGVKIKDATHLIRYLESPEFQTFAETLASVLAKSERLSAEAQSLIEIEQKRLEEITEIREQLIALGEKFRSVLADVEALKMKWIERLESRSVSSEKDSSSESSLH